MTTLLIATRNAHKLHEIKTILGPGFQCRSLADLPQAPVAVEDAATFAGNARKKAAELAEWLAARPEGKWEAHEPCQFVLADDSGLEVDALGGAPGVHSARYAALDAHRAGNSHDADNNAKLLRLLAQIPAIERTARFRCVLALVPLVPGRVSVASPVCFVSDAELLTEFFEGTSEGRIAFAPSGQGGFGYDPLFIPEGFSVSFAELGEDEKNRLSHRARALAKLSERLKGQS